jgi:hypothetical protein
MKFTIAVPTASQTPPAAAATINMFNSVTAFGPQQIRHLPVCRVSFAAEHDQGFTVIGSRSKDGGATWDVIDSQAVSVVANSIAGPFDYLIDTYEDFKIDVTNGGTDQTVWKPEVHGFESRQPGS